MRRAFFLVLASLGIFGPACRSADGATPVHGSSPGEAAALSPLSSSPIASFSESAADPSPFLSFSPPAAAALTPPPPPPKPVAIGKGTRVLVLGDSMAPTLALRMKQLVEEAGGSLVRDYWPGSTTVAWVHQGRLRQVLHREKPDVVFVVLGSNEVFSPFPKKLAPHMRELARRVSPRPCAWIGPPLWKAARRRGEALVALQRENAAPCAFFDSTGLPLARWKEDIHPTPEGGRVWLEAVWEKLVEVRAE